MIASVTTFTSRLAWPGIVLFCVMAVVTLNAQQLKPLPGSLSPSPPPSPQPPPDPVVVPAPLQPIRLHFSEDDSAILFFPNASPTEAPLLIKLHKKMQVETRVMIRQDSSWLNYVYNIVVLPASPDWIDVIGLLESPEDHTSSTTYPCIAIPSGTKWGGVTPRVTSNIISSGMSQDLLGGAEGEWVQWGGDGKLLPGQRIELPLRSQFLPGFAVVYYDHVPFEEFPPGMDPGVLTNEEWKLLTIQHVTKHVVTIGPRYPPTTPKAAIAQDIEKELQYALKFKNIPSSPWTEAAVGYLESAATGKAQPLERLWGVALSDLEKDMTTALAYTFLKTP